MRSGDLVLARLIPLVGCSDVEMLRAERLRLRLRLPRMRPQALLSIAPCDDKPKDFRAMLPPGLIWSRVLKTLDVCNAVRRAYAERRHYCTSILHSIVFLIYFPNHDVFLLASFRAFCYAISSAIIRYL